MSSFCIQWHMLLTEGFTCWPLTVRLPFCRAGSQLLLSYWLRLYYLWHSPEVCKSHLPPGFYCVKHGQILSDRQHHLCNICPCSMAKFPDHCAKVKNSSLIFHLFLSEIRSTFIRVESLQRSLPFMCIFSSAFISFQLLNLSCVYLITWMSCS